jgi:putative PIN family toxin of toxin-antitoxin system
MGAGRQVAAPRVVLDTDVVLSALVFSRGSLAALGPLWQQGRFVPLASRETAGELLRVLAYPKFRLTADEREDLLSEYLPSCETVAVPRRLRDVPACRDPGDVPFLRLALARRASRLVTGDKDLLAAAESFRVPILTPARFGRSMAPPDGRAASR